jgi:murein DD-endopeptidase MepM/ murein hydrolase activator NlpD
VDARAALWALLAGVGVACLLVVLGAGDGKRARASDPLRIATPNLAALLSADLEGTPSAADIRRARRPLSERKRLLAAHPFFALYRIAKRRFDVPWLLVASVHYQETGFAKAPAGLAQEPTWKLHRFAARGLARPARYPNRSERHPSIGDDFDVVMAIAAELAASKAQDLGDSAVRALAALYGTEPAGRLAAAMVIERARAWRVLGTLPLPGRGELASPVGGVVSGCGYFGCPRPGHLHNGIDLIAPAGTPIHAADGGTVALLESIDQSGGYGNFICVQHRPHLATCYAHLSAVAAGLRVGERVRRGEVIGLVGSTGSSSAPHLHFEVRRGPAACQTCAVDPLPYLSGDVPQAVVPEMLTLAGTDDGDEKSTDDASWPTATLTTPEIREDRPDHLPADRLRQPSSLTRRMPARKPGSVPPMPPPPPRPAAQPAPAAAPLAPAPEPQPDPPAADPPAAEPPAAEPTPPPATETTPSTATTPPPAAQTTAPATTTPPPAAETIPPPPPSSDPAPPQ